MELYSTSSRRFQPASDDSSGVAVVIIVPVVAVVGVVCVILFFVWRWLRSRRDERRKNEGEELRLRMHREGYVRTEPEAVSMAEVVLRPLTRWPCPNRWEGLSSSGTSDTFSHLDLEEGLLMPHSSAVHDDLLGNTSSLSTSFSGALLCPMCHDPLARGVAITRLLCGHVFHHTCVRAAVRRMLTHYEPLVCPLQNCRARILESAVAARLRDEVQGREQRADETDSHSFTPPSFMGEGVPIVSIQNPIHTDNGERENTCRDPPLRSASHALRQGTVPRNSSFGSSHDLLSSSRSSSSSSLTSNSNSDRENPDRRTTSRLSTRKPSSGMADQKRVEEVPLSSGLPLTPRSVLKKTSSYPLRKSHRSTDRMPR